jgi:predicted RNase H-like HicB family nuclease
MKKIIVVIERSKNHYGGYAENVEGLYAAGNNPEEVKVDFLNAIELFKEANDRKHWPAILKGAYEIEYKMDIPTFMAAYSGILSKSAIERLTGINRVQLTHYTSGFRNPRSDKRQKIQQAIYTLADDLKRIHLV